MKNKTYFAIILIFILGFVGNSKVCFDAVRSALELCCHAVIPSLFPFLVISKITIELGLAHSIARRFESTMRTFFHLPGSSAVAFIIGILSGYPVGAKIVVTLYEEKLCSENDAEQMLAFCNNSGPLFIIGTVGTAMLGSIQTGIILYSIHVLSAITVGLLFRGAGASHTDRRFIHYKTSLLSDSLTKSILESVHTIILICGYVVFFAAIIAVLRIFGFFSTTAVIFNKLGIPPEITESFLAGLIEISSGCTALSLSSAPLPLISFIVAWSGISAIAQVGGIIGKSRLSLKCFAISKLVHGIIAAIYTVIFIKFRPALPIFSTQKNRLQVIAVGWIPLLLYIFLLIIILIMFSKNHRKQ